MLGVVVWLVFFSSRRRHTRCALVTGVQTCALSICFATGAVFSMRNVDLALREPAVPGAEQARPAATRNYHAGQPDTLMHALERAVANAGDKVFLDVCGDTLTYREIDSRATRLAHALAGLGIAKGDTVVSIFDTSVDVITCWFADR